MNRTEELAAIEAALKDPERYHRITWDELRTHIDANPNGVPSRHALQMKAALQRRRARRKKGNGG